MLHTKIILEIILKLKHSGRFDSLNIRTLSSHLNGILISTIIGSHFRTPLSLLFFFNAVFANLEYLLTWLPLPQCTGCRGIS